MEAPKDRWRSRKPEDEGKQKANRTRARPINLDIGADWAPFLREREGRRERKGPHFCSKYIDGNIDHDNCPNFVAWVQLTMSLR